jgi:two-component system nitrogen regulation response regulator NtrX
MSSQASNKPRALIVDDEPSICESLAGVLSDEGWDSVAAFSGTEGIKVFKEKQPDLVFLDIWMPGIDGIETLQRLKTLGREAPIVIMSGHGTIETAVKATRLGAYEYLEKPLSIEKVLPMLDHAASVKRLAGEGRLEKASPSSSSNLIGESDALSIIRGMVEKVAPRNAWVLLTGENGTGKEVVAQQIHYQSSRANKPFIALNCAAIPETLIESELFGHEKGAFTNAISQKKGKFELADKGTLFLDEIGDMSLNTQAKVLRVLQEQQFERIGGSSTVSVDVRVVAATNKDLNEMIETGEFREDLFYRLNVVPFHLPPLRERGRDVLLIAEHFLANAARDLKEERKHLSPETEQVFLSYSWPGNVRELMNTIERLSIMVPGNVIKPSDLPVHVVEEDQSSLSQMSASLAQNATLKEAKSEFEKSFIIEKLVENNWNVSKTAEAIGIERSNLHRKLKTYDIDPKKAKG